ncbi:MAG: dynamin family protein [Oscillatoriales cyanobacterium SM2_2_1]|nr:dynamin family protein [Oscillatoriales cyanobacterium SM2_2_1]
MTEPICAHLSDDVEGLIQMLPQELAVRSQLDVTAAKTSLKKAVAPKFEIVFAGAFSAGKSMLINALLGRKLLYSAEGHATGTECQIAYAEPDQERVVLTFMSEVEVREQAEVLCRRLGLPLGVNINNSEVVQSLQSSCQRIIEQEGGESKSDLAKQAGALRLLLEGFLTNRDRIGTVSNQTFSMESFNFSNLQEAASYARRGGNSAVLKRIEYYCHDSLLEDGNVLVDTPGIDAPVRKDAELTYRKIQDPDISAVVCILKAAETGELTTEETELLETIRRNPGIRDRVFYVFNRADRTWYNSQLRQRLDRIINDQFRDSRRVYRTSGLLGFYGRLLEQTSERDRFGLDSIFREEVQGSGGREESPMFVTEFNNYCGTSGKLVGGQFRIEVRGYESPNENYLRILRDSGLPLVRQLISDSGIEEFRTSMIRYLTEEKRPLLFAQLANDLQPLCIALRRHLLEHWDKTAAQPRDIAAIKAQELEQLSRDLKRIGDELRTETAHYLNAVISSSENLSFEAAYRELQRQMVQRLDDLIRNFSVAEAHRRAQASHRRNSVVPVMGILTEAFYYLANELEDVLAAGSESIIRLFFQDVLTLVKGSESYRNLYRLLGNDGGIEAELLRLEGVAIAALVNEARTECDRYVRERPETYVEGTISLWQLNHALQQSCRGYDFRSMVEAEPAIKELLSVDFEQKVKDTMLRTFRQTINQTINTHVLTGVEKITEEILLKYDQAREFLEQTLEKEARSKIETTLRSLDGIRQKVEEYNRLVRSVNHYFEEMHLDRQKLPPIAEADLETADPVMVPPEADATPTV